MPDETPEPAAFDPNAATIPVASLQPTMARGEIELPLPEELTALLPGGNYHVESFLGQGGMGAVYKGVQVRLKRPVAIKIMRRDQGRDYGFEQRFEREAQAMAKLNHPGIVSVIDYGEAGADHLYIVMELVDGADLMDVIRTGRMTQEMALTLLPQICDALQFAHDHGIIHRDIKPSNIMLTRDGRVKMADFGLAKRFDVESSFRTQTGTSMGTPDYAAPEQFDTHATIDHRADIYALGVMIYQMITGQLPRGVWKPPSQRAEIAPQWDDIVAHAMQADPKDRYQHASEIKTDVSRITPSVAGGTDPGQGRAAAPPAAANDPAAAQRPKAALAGTSALPKSRSPLLFGVIGTMVILAVGLFFALRDTAPGNGGFQPPPNTAARSSNTGDSKSPLPDQPLPESGWQPLFSPDETPPADGSWKREDGLIHILVRAQKNMPSADGAVRAALRVREGMQGCSVITRADMAKGHYKLVLNDDLKKVMLRFFDAGSTSTLLGEYQIPARLKAGDKVSLELRAQGSKLTGFVNGVARIEVEDTKLTSPGFWGALARPGWFESVDVQTVGPEGRAAAPPAAASSPAATDPVAPRQTLDLLALADPKRDRLKADGTAGTDAWTKSGGLLAFAPTGGRPGKISAPVAVEGLHDYEIEVIQPRNQASPVVLDCPITPDSQATISVVPGVGIELRADETRRPRKFGTWPMDAANPPWQIAVHIQRGADDSASMISVTINGIPAGEWRGNLTRLGKTPEPHAEFPGRLVPALFATGGEAAYSSWTLRVFDGEAKVLR